MSFCLNYLLVLSVDLNVFAYTCQALYSIDLGKKEHFYASQAVGVL